MHNANYLLSKLIEFNALIVGNSDDEVIKKSLVYIQEELSEARAFIAFYDKENEQFELVNSLNDEHFLNGAIVNASDTILSEMVVHKKAIFREDFTQSPFGPVDEKLIAMGIVCDYSAPLCIKNEFIGSINVTSSKINGLNEQHRLFIDLVSNQLVFVINNYQLRSQLRLSNNRYRQAEIISNVGSWEYNLASDKLIWSEQVYRIFGVEPFSFEPKMELFFNYVHPDDREELNNRYQDHLINNVSYNYIFRAIRADGKLIYIQGKGESRRDDSGNPIKTLGIISDITQLKKYELELEQYKTKLEQLVEDRTSELTRKIDELAESKEHFRSIAETIPSFMTLLDEKMNFIYVNRVAEGLEEKDVLGHSLLEFVPVENRDIVKRSFKSAIITGQTVQYISEGYRNNGDYGWFKTTMSPVIRDNMVQVLAIATDITDLKNAEERLIESESRYKLISEYTNDVVFLLDENYKYIYLSPSVEKLYGYTTEEIFEVDSFGGIHPEDLIEVKQKIGETLKNEDNHVLFQYRRKHKKGHYLWIEALANFAFENGKLKTISGRLSDISDRKRAEFDKEKLVEQLFETNNKIKEAQNQILINEKMASLGSLMAGIAHEINNPLNFISGGIESLKVNFSNIMPVLQRCSELDKSMAPSLLNELVEMKNAFQFEKSLSFIQNSIDNLDNGVNRTQEILDGLKIFSRSNTDELVESDIHQNLDATLIVLRNSYKEYVTLVKDYDESLSKVLCNPGKLNQVFTNIISNAVYELKKQHDETEKGTLFIKTDQCFSNDLHEVKISIGNNGEGIAKELGEKIFEPFFTTKPVGEGTGLGLAISYSIIKDHKGRIEIEEKELSLDKSREDTFTIFNIFLPLK